MKFARVRRLYHQIRGGKLTLKRATGSVALGLFVGLLPLYGFHLPLCLGLSFLLGLDGLVAYGAANISNPFFAPFIVLLEIEVGHFVFTGDFVGLNLESIKHQGLAAFTVQTLFGALLVALAGACLGAAITLVVGLVLRAYRRPDFSTELRQALRETTKRYAGAGKADRHYVHLKLWTDPLTKQLEQLHFSFGQVTDVGCGRGQFGLLLVALGKTNEVYGFDWDPTKVETAQRAAGDTGHFVMADLHDPPLLPTDTVLLFDVLHYLSPETQQRLLARTYAALHPGGHLLLRDVDKNRGPSAALTRLCERIGTRFAMNRSGQLTFRSSAEIRRELLTLGFELELAPSGPLSLLDNQLWIYRKPLAAETDRAAEPST